MKRSFLLQVWLSPAFLPEPVASANEKSQIFCVIKMCFAVRSTYFLLERGRGWVSIFVFRKHIALFAYDGARFIGVVL
uniref:Putative secreted protein n=1 Tax=Anopheles triannulatus TaxID=58253 RepID=A0A2M4B6B0_9DIPT